MAGIFFSLSYQYKQAIPEQRHEACFHVAFSSVSIII